MPNTPRLNLPYPLAEDPPDGPTQIGALASQLDSLIASDGQGTLAARPAAGTRGRYYFATDQGSAVPRRRLEPGGRAGDIPVVSSLPAGAVTGDECYLKTAGLLASRSGTCATTAPSPVPTSGSTSAAAPLLRPNPLLLNHTTANVKRLHRAGQLRVAYAHPPQVSTTCDSRERCYSREAG